MFVIEKNLKGKLCVITDNAEIAEKIRDENARIPVWYTGAPTVETVQAIATGLDSEFGRFASYKAGGHARYHAFLND